MKTIEFETEYARIYYRDGTVAPYQALAYAVWLALPKGTKAAFRGKGDQTPVYPHDFVDKR